eukprot:14872310-Alexandrium_andersonii.AAC.1
MEAARSAASPGLLAGLQSPCGANQGARERLPPQGPRVTCEHEHLDIPVVLVGLPRPCAFQRLVPRSSDGRQVLPDV